MLQKRFFVMAFAAAGLMTLAGCNQETDQDRLLDAQYCLNDIRGTNPTAAAACVAGIKDIQTTQSYVLQCSAAYIGQGFTSADKLSKALDQLQGSGSGTSALLGLMAFSASDADEAIEIAQETYDVCVKSNQKAMSLLAAMTKSATIIAGSALSAININDDPEDIATAVNDAIDQLVGKLTDPDPDVQDKAVEQIVEIGTAVIQTYQTGCNSGSQVNADLCNQIQSVLGPVDPNDFASVDAEQFAKNLLDRWRNP